MVLPDLDALRRKIDIPVIRAVGDTAVQIGMPCYVVGGYVRDLFLGRHSKDIDFVTVGSGVDLAEAVAAKLGKGAHVNLFRTYGTAQIKHRGVELEFVGARKESYRHDSRNPQVSAGTLDDDISRRDFTINAMAISITPDDFGRLVDNFGGVDDLERRIIRTPLDPDITFSDDPLRMMRAVRFATQLQFDIAPETFEAIKRNAQRIKIITRERIADELQKIMMSPMPSIGWRLLLESGLLALIFPELAAMRGVETVRGRGHKDNFYHTLEVLDNVARNSDNLWLRWAALLHDIAKPVTKRWDDSLGWTFHNHNFVGAKMLPKLFRRLKLPQDDKLKYVSKLVELHMRPIALVEDTVTDSAVRRLLVEAGDDIDDLMTLCRADITSKNPEKVRRNLENFDHVVAKMQEIESKDRLRAWRPPIDGCMIMEMFGLPQSREVGMIKSYMEEHLLDSENPNDPEEARRLVIEKAAEMGLSLKDN
ncbi:MAG: HD domain-containing protein [Muribaculaceae bacterium]|jgi:hypothetical protein|nr:HD domain-containing protein [Muribaculaceae bacterium]